MRTIIVLGTAAMTLAACGGGSGAGPETAGAIAPVAGADPTAQFTAPTEPRTYVGVGGMQRYNYVTDARVDSSGNSFANQQAQSYGGNATRVRESSIAVTYDPRDATFILKINDPTSGAVTDARFQDPGNRTDFGGSVQPQWGTPNLAQAGKYSNNNIQYLQAGEGNPLSTYRVGGSGAISYGTPTTSPNGESGTQYQATTFFFEKPGSSTKYVTFAGYLNNRLSYGIITVDGTTPVQNGWELDRGAFAYGMLTDNGAVPSSGTATFTGNMLGTMVYNATLDQGAGALPSYFQWLSGTATTTVDFGSKDVTLALEGVVLAPQIDRFTDPKQAYIVANSTFAGNGNAKIDLVQKGGFTGSFENGSFVFTAPAGTTYSDGATQAGVNIAGSSIDGAFYGPKAEEVGGGFRVVGGTPDERIDILGAFTGKK